MSRSVLVAALLVAASTWLHGQPFQAQVELVRFGVTVVDKKGNYVADLGPDDFEVLEKGRPQRLQYFIRGNGQDFFVRPEGIDDFVQVDAASDADGGTVRAAVPLHLGLLFDTSGSMSDDLQLSRNAAVKFLNVFERAEDMTLVDFDTEVRVARYGQNDFPRMVERIRNRKADGFTALYDALGVYLDGASGQTGQKVLVVYTDGGDTRSAINFSELLNLLKASDVTLYAIGFLQHAGSAATDLRMKLQQIADVTGGVALFPSTMKELDAKYEDVVKELAARYTLGYASSDPSTDGAWRDVQIKLRRPDARGLKLRVRKGYFGPFKEPAR